MCCWKIREVKFESQNQTAQSWGRREGSHNSMNFPVKAKDVLMANMAEKMIFCSQHKRRRNHSQVCQSSQFPKCLFKGIVLQEPKTQRLSWVSKHSGKKKIDGLKPCKQRKGNSKVQQKEALTHGVGEEGRRNRDNMSTHSLKTRPNQRTTDTSLPPIPGPSINKMPTQIPPFSSIWTTH